MTPVQGVFESLEGHLINVTHGTGIFNSNTRFVALTVRLSGCILQRIHEVIGLEARISRHGIGLWVTQQP